MAEKLDAKTLFRIAWDKLHVERGRPADDFATFAINRYGRTLAESFLLNYSEKLWGEPPSKLSVAVSGGRLRGLNLKNLIRSALLGDSAAQNHLDGSFLYPKYGIGMIADKLSESIGYERIRTKSRVSRLVHKAGKIERVMLNDGETEIPATTVINTLPLTLALKILDPPPPPEFIDTAAAIKYRHLMLCVFCLNRNSFSPNASLYFPSEEFPFTRLYEPKNRSPYMAPEGQTTIVLELPCYTEDAIWNMSDEALRSEVWDALCRVKPIRREDVIHFLTYRLPFAYPVLTVGFEENVSSLNRLLGYLWEYASHGKKRTPPLPSSARSVKIRTNTRGTNRGFAHARHHGVSQQTGLDLSPCGSSVDSKGETEYHAK